MTNASSAQSSLPSQAAAVADLMQRPNAQVLILGAGINGIATFRDLALQGIDVVLVDAADVMSGASAASSHMIHGGVRYLENGEFRLVREAVQERNRLLRIAPHLVKPLETTIPIYSTFSGVLSAPMRFLMHGSKKSKERGAALIKFGLTLYDSFSRDGGRVPRHRFHGRKKSLHEFPQLDPNVKYTASYWDASAHSPERLGIDMLRDAITAGNGRARVASYTAAIGTRDGGVLLCDNVQQTEILFNADVVVNATGPWVELTNEGFGEPTAFMGGTKGSHIVLDHPELLAATKGHEIFFEHNDGRIVLIHPLNGRVLVGTTDLEHDMREPAECTEAEIDYFFELIAHVFPGIKVGRQDIVHLMSGVRPLPRHVDQAPGFVSRDYRVERSDFAGASKSMLTLIGGKLTTFRASAETITDLVLSELGASRNVSTAELAIGGGRDFPASDRAKERWIAAAASSIPRERLAILLERYGTLALEVADEIEQGPDSPLEFVSDYSHAEIEYLTKNESVVHLTDLLRRRTNLAFVGTSASGIAEIANIMAPILAWNEAQIAAEIAAAEQELLPRTRLALAAAPQ
ncbi:glycerol-3-phosphate dehydrogenase/oxidase [Leucobacter sp. UT-8R-CII-1-4]|uniref:glycerol-3-phosphate dehydrogenase/oxidase n=1 Tax=Leucobacter sp. UT-8R-CII-1-4 TaxID=3040075 RepID=UPI0024A9119C|nr:glycerol-3-phosphate dehydrogenase/oxidase [Leucobacter sp. UT-8R-CII-1-4]MDI6023822.1 glycerol-3-phosphate dehydrogenase/oxidase [Leucobacter sp. UT-8R-CII-1-4]